MTPSPRSPAIAAAVLALVALAAHSPALRGGFVFDDHILLLGREAIVRQPLAELWFGTSVPDYWPLTWTSLWIEWRIWGGAAGPLHAVNLLLHAAAAVLVWRTLAALRVPGAWIAALLFAVHPVGVESVAWISERKNGLSAVLVLGALLAWMRADDARRPGVPWPALGLFVLALLAKTSVVALPLVLAAIILVRRRRIDRAEWVSLAPFFAASLLAGAATLWFQHRNAMKLVLLRPRGLAERLGEAGWALLSYLERALAPIRVWFVYPPWPVGPESLWFWAPLVVAIALPLAAWRLGGTWGRRVLLGYGLFAVVLLPVIGILDIAYLGVAPMSNHLQYLAMIGPLAIVGTALAAAQDRWPTAVRPMLAVLVAALAVATFRRAGTFESDLSLWRTAANDTPDQLFAVSMYTRILREKGDREGAARELARAAAAASDPATRLRLQSLAAQDADQLGEAFESAFAAERIRSDPAFQHELGWKLLRARQAPAAVAVFEPLARTIPASPHVMYSLGVALGASNRVAEALEALRRAAALAPANARIREALAMALFRLGRLDEAREHAAFALGTIPSDSRVDAQFARWAAMGSEAPAR